MKLTFSHKPSAHPFLYPTFAGKQNISVYRSVKHIFYFFWIPGLS